MDNTGKFSNKVSNYVKYRPTYPFEYIKYLLDEVGLSGSVVADVGAGTGILTKLLAHGVKCIYAVEPNLNMRTACEAYCNRFESFSAIDGSAERTALPDASVDFITVAQAFHWFDREKTKAEFQRILRKNGRVILVWNNRAAENEFIRANDEFCRRSCPEYNGFSGGVGTDPSQFADFFKDGVCEYRIFNNDRRLTLEEYVGGSLSASYAPAKGDTNYEEFTGGLKELFNRYSSDNRILMPTVTRSYIGGI